MGQMRDQLDRDAQPFGIHIVDVRIRRVDLPEQNSQAVYQRMQTERQREAAEFRAQGSQKAQEIRARADRDVTVLLADANSQVGDGPRRGRRHPQPDLRRRLRPGSGFLQLLSFDAGLREKHAAFRYAFRAAAGFGFLPLFRRSERQGRCRTRGDGSVGPGRTERSRRNSPASAGIDEDFLAALGLFFAIEGILLAAFPGGAKRTMATVLESPDGRCASPASSRHWSASSSSGWCAG